MRLLIITALALCCAAPSFAEDEKPETYTTAGWQDAIDHARETGKLILIYNGWQKAKV